MKLKQFPEYETNPFPSIVPTPNTYMIMSDGFEEGKECNYFRKGMMSKYYNAKNDSLPSVLHHIIGLRIPESQEILLPKELFFEVTGKKSRITYYRTINRMLEENLIAKKKYHPNTFFLNPTVAMHYKQP